MGGKREKRERAARRCAAKTTASRLRVARALVSGGVYPPVVFYRTRSAVYAIAVHREIAAVRDRRQRFRPGVLFVRFARRRFPGFYSLYI